MSIRTVLSTLPVSRLKEDLFLVPLRTGQIRTAEVLEIDRILDGTLLREITCQHFTGLDGQAVLVQGHPPAAFRYLLVIGCGDGLTPAFSYQLAQTTIQRARELHAISVAILLPEKTGAQEVRAIAEGLQLAAYRFNRFRSRPDTTDAEVRVTLAAPDITADLSTSITQAEVLGAVTCYARDLVNTPAAVLTPARLATEARKLANRSLTVRIRDARGIARLKMGALLGVARGSDEEPRFIELVYRPDGRRKRRIAIVGKGITFDSGGLSLKRSDSMQTQKRDMAGAAVVLAVMKALPALKPPVEVLGYVPTCENMPSGRALKPGDVLRAHNGKSIEVLNTDAEGRLVLADALSYAARKHPDVIVDLATLTAAVTSALGARYAAILGNNRQLITDCIAAGAVADEKLWELPLVEEYRCDIDSNVADLKNVGEGQAGTIVAALFLREFVGKIPWAHIDFSSTAFTNGYRCHPKGATGFGVRTLLNYLLRI